MSDGIRSNPIGAIGVLIAAVTLALTILGSRNERAQTDQVRNAAHADEPVALSIGPAPGGEIAILNVSRFPVKNVEVEWGSADYSSTCDAVLSGSGILSGVSTSVVPDSYWDEMRPLETRVLNIGKYGQHARPMTRRGCEHPGEGQVYPLTNEINDTLPIKVLLAGDAVPACSLAAPCKRVVHVVVRARHPFTSEVREFEEFFVGGAAGELIPSRFFYQPSAGALVWRAEGDRKMFTRIAQWKARMAALDLPRDKVRALSFEGRGLWQATGTPRPDATGSQ